MLATAKFRAKRKGLPFNLTAEFLERVCALGVCAYCEVPVVHGGKGRHADSGELDRVDPALGYVKGNVVVACHSCNQYKSDLMPAQLRALALLADQIEAVQKGRHLIRR